MPDTSLPTPKALTRTLPLTLLPALFLLSTFPIYAQETTPPEKPLPFIARDRAPRLSEKHKDDIVRVLIQPNGWGRTPEAAIKDLDRVMRIYENKPGFIRYSYKKVIHFSRNLYQCDGQCSYLVKRGLRSRNARTTVRNRLKK